MRRHTHLVALVLILAGPVAAAPARAASSAIVISPGSVSLEAGATHQFMAAINGAALNATWSTTGGTITSNGLFTAGQTAGKYLVTADTHGNRALKGTAVVTIASSRSLTRVTVTPSSAVLGGGATQPFSATGTWSDGTTAPIAVTWSSTGGAMTSVGLYTAGTTPGEYRITATSGMVSATATVKVTTPAVLTTLAIHAGADPLMQPGQSTQFSASGTWSDGSTLSLAVSWTANGGAISSAGLYTAGQTLGSFQVTAGNGTITAVASIYIGSAGTISIFPGDSFQAIVDGSPAGSTFLIRAGVHRRQSVSPKDGMTFLGESGAIMDGENYTPHAFETLASIPRNVTIRGLVIERYVPALNLGAIQADNGADWIVDGNEIRYNANVGLKVGPRMQVRNNFVHHNGVTGISGYRSDGLLIEQNEVSYNNPSDTFADPWLSSESGMKFFEINDLIVRSNNVHHNNGIGIWCDNPYLNVLIEANAVTLNTTGGIWQENGYSAVIRHNTVDQNGLAAPAPDWLQKAGIMVSNSPNVEIYGNTVSDNANGITGMQATGYDPTGLYGTKGLRNLDVHDNIVTMTNGVSGLVQNVSDSAYFTSHNNRWVNNTYQLGTNASYFSWFNSRLNDAQWQSYGQDLTATFVR